MICTSSYHLNVHQYKDGNHLLIEHVSGIIKIDRRISPEIKVDTRREDLVAIVVTWAGGSSSSSSHVRAPTIDGLYISHVIGGSLMKKYNACK